MKKLGFLFFLALFCTSSAAFAECAAVGQCEGVTIDRLYLQNNIIYIGTSGNEQLLKPFCDPGGGNYIKLLDTHPLRDQIYALLLTSHKDRSPISIKMNIPSTGCGVEYVVSDAN